jgi:hypothetical protein
MNLDTPRNRVVLAYLRRSVPPNPVPRPAVISPEDAEDPYAATGAHPEVVQRVWDELGRSLPVACGRVVHSTPALLHPKTGTIFALALGTGYALRLPPALIEAAISGGARTSVRYTDGSDLNAPRDLGNDWVLGAWLPAEPGWCAKAFDYFGQLETTER